MKHLLCLRSKTTTTTTITAVLLPPPKKGPSCVNWRVGVLLIQAMPEIKRLYPMDPFPYSLLHLLLLPSIQRFTQSSCFFSLPCSEFSSWCSYSAVNFHLPLLQLLPLLLPSPIAATTTLRYAIFSLLRV